MADEAFSQKDPLAVEFGRRGGKSRLVKMTAEERTRVAKLAAQARWAKKASAPDPKGPNDPKGPHRDPGEEGTGILLSARRKPVVPVSVTSQPGGLHAAA